MKKELPDGWEWKKFGDIIELKYGKGLKKENRQSFGNVSVYGSNGIVGYHDEAFVNETCLIVGRKGSIGAIHISNESCWPIDTTYYVVPPKELDVFFLFYLLSTLNLDRLDKSTAIPGLNRNDVYSKKIPLPPIEIQHKIVAILEKADDTKKIRAQADKLTQQLLQSVFLEMFGDPVTNPKGWLRKTLSELSSEVIDCPHSTPKHEDIITPYPCIRTTELKNGYINWSKMKYVNEEGYKDRTKRLVPIADDIVYGREGTFGEAIRIPDNVNICLGQRVMLFRPKSNLCNSDFFWALINSDAMYRQALKKTCGSTVGHINVKDIKNFVCICPPIEIQEQFSKIVKLIDSIRHNQQQSSQEIDNLFNALMQKAFKGDLIH